jgi:hypothetical protein
VQKVGCISGRSAISAPSPRGCRSTLDVLGPPPTKTPDALEAKIVRLRQALSPDGSGPVSAAVIRDHLRQHGGDVLPSRRTIYRILNRQAKEVNSHRQNEKKR